MCFFDFLETLQRTLHLPPDKKSRPEFIHFLNSSFKEQVFLSWMSFFSSYLYLFACLNINPICYDEEAERIVELFGDQG